MNKTTLMLKAFVIAALTCVILIALFLVNNVIDDRQRFREEAVQSIEASYAGPQNLVGPVLVRPYTQSVEVTEVTDKGVKRTRIDKQQLTAISFPRELAIKATMVPSERRHGLYKVAVYEMQGQIAGHIDLVDPQTQGTVVWGEPYLALSVSDVRGIVGTPRVTVNGREQTMRQGAPAASGWQPNLRVPLGAMGGPGGGPLRGRLDFDVDMNLAGTQALSLAPVGDSNRFEVASAWASPLFGGRFLPRTREISAQGFHAVWEVSSLASATQGQMMGAAASPTPGQAAGTDAGSNLDLMTVNLTTLLDPYALSERAVKYGILFVLLTFGGFFVFELVKQLPIHPIQYLLVGFGLAIFFLLLISFSEHMAFGLAYLLASAACIGLLTFYLSYVLRSAMRGAGFGAMLSTMYAAIYGLLISEDNALILGSLMLFAVLAAVMVVTRKVDWYRGAGAAAGPVPPPPPPVSILGI